MTPVRAFALAALGVLASARLAPAQCPEGTPPPCRPAAARVPAPSPNSVAVLYFDNLSRDTADAFLADGLTDEIIIRLGQVPRLEGKPRSEVQRFRGRLASQKLAALGRALRAAYLVTGSVQRAGDRVRLRYEVIRAATRARVGGDIIDRASGDLLTVESDIAREVVTAVTGRLLPAERARLSRPLTTDAIAYEEYLRGLEELNHSYDEAAVRSAIEHFDRAIARDMRFAAALAGLSQAWGYLADGYVSGREAFPHVRDAATRALALDSSQARACAELGFVALTLDLDSHEAERLARRAVALDPRGDQPHLSLSYALVAAGRIDEGLEEARRAWQADSLVSMNGTSYLWFLIWAHRLDAAAVLLPRLRATLPREDVDAFEGYLLAARGDLRDALHLLDWRYYGGLNAGMYVRALLARGDTATARAAADSMLAARLHGYFNPVALAKVHAALGDVDTGIEWLRRAVEERTLWLFMLRLDDELAPLRADPRYAALDRQLRY